MNSLSFRKRRAVSEIIGTLMVLAVTVAGAVFISNAAHEVFFTVEQNPSIGNARVDSVLLTGYDTRDSVELTDVPHLNNTFNQLLCTDSCIANPDEIPKNGGTEFIVLKVRNKNVDSVFVHNILINNVGHTWDSQTGTKVLNPEFYDITGKYPLAGSFSIINATNNDLTQKATNELNGDEEVRLVIKLSDQIPQDIGMWAPLRILVNFGGAQPAEFIVLSGDAKW